MKGCMDYTEEARNWTQSPDRRSLLPRAVLIVMLGILVGFVLIVFWPRSADEGFAVTVAEEASEENTAAAVAEEAPAPAEGETQDRPKGLLSVYLTGAVASPGVYELAASSRLNDAVAMAGGLIENSATEYVNLAALLEDGQHIHIPTTAEIESGEAERIVTAGAQAPVVSGAGGSSGGSAAGATVAAQKVNINTADNAELETLPGIGVATAQRIVDYRAKNGAFGSVEDLKNVSGIGDKKYAELVDKICV
ncbi:MAG: ComEA family DNA-binding protein [Coriobacteriales bacterium]|nr:ComEA family DNA-binding protein [Coriobacteriales bacterium]